MNLKTAGALMAVGLAVAGCGGEKTAAAPTSTAATTKSATAVDTQVKDECVDALKARLSVEPITRSMTVRATPDRADANTHVVLGEYTTRGTTVQPYKAFTCTAMVWGDKVVKVELASS